MNEIYSVIQRFILESPPGEWALNQLRELLIGALRQGPVPQHVAFEMDGNRRYARSHRMETVEGHHRGFEALARIMEVCYKSGVKTVTVYAFSIENFNRPKYEVEGLMQLAKVKLEQLTTYGDVLDRYGASVRVLGQLDLVREDVLQVVDKAVARTRNNKKAVLNICFPYTSRAEMTTAIQSTVAECLAPPPPKNTPFSQTRIRQTILSRQLNAHERLPTIRDNSPEKQTQSESATETDAQGDDADEGASSSTTLLSDSPPQYGLEASQLPSPESITVDTLEKHMYTADDPPLDLFVRTSGVERLSDFMLWQCHQDTQIFFLSCLWPDFDLHHFIWVLLEWQWRVKQSEREERPTRRRDSKPRKMSVE
ncbi:ditrans,polycis-polyprenyl diphosphate synthase [Geosmithia morbida]|uniref:Alkyl transferase n=1 Tax=Geosmithia morbida TaxID=1094350 RepID=A0A9P4YXI3_9HYPO|nr:ditrans,polycis-polyprenyl diphosphate synthase [Geosmithia morbida]KAF4123865.1 ditrans,polycis-polyprenyl diphosphate synthase [Geosmithia morbida]